MATVTKDTPSASQNKPAPAGETTADVVYLGNKRVKARFKWRPFDGGPQYTKEAVFDYSKCTEEQVFMLAQDSATIKIQAKLRQAAALGKVDPKLFDEVNVLQDVITSTKGDPKAAAILALRKAGASEATIAAAIADLNKPNK